MGVYFLMGNYVVYLGQVNQQMAGIESLDMPYSIYASAVMSDSSDPMAGWITPAE
jgi:hypothetical protein